MPQNISELRCASFIHKFILLLRSRPPSDVAHLVLASSSLASLELVKVPAADGQVALVLVHAAAEVGDVLRAHGGRLVLRVHGDLAVLRLRYGLVGGRGGRAGSTAEPATDGVADRRADCDTAGRVSVRIAYEYSAMMGDVLTQQCWPSGRRDRYHRCSERARRQGERREEERVGWQAAGRRCWPGGPEQVAEAQSGQAEEQGA